MDIAVLVLPSAILVRSRGVGNSGCDKKSCTNLPGKTGCLWSSVSPLPITGITISPRHARRVTKAWSGLSPVLNTTDNPAVELSSGIPSVQIDVVIAQGSGVRYEGRMVYDVAPKDRVISLKFCGSISTLFGSC